MLLWQRKNVPKLAFGAQLSFLIVLMHAVALLLLCIHSVAVHDELSVDISNSYLIGADIIVVPFQKAVKQLPVVAPQPAVNQMQRDATVINDVKHEQKKVVPAQPAKPELSTPKQATPEPSLNKPAKDTVPEIAKKSEPVALKTQTANVEKPQVPAEQVAKPAVPTAQYIGTRQLQTMQIQRAIVEQVHMHWHPPEGLEPDLEVVLAIHIGNNGDVTDVDTTQSSGVFAYDVHARSAVYEMQFPKACWGKTITISFK